MNIMVSFASVAVAPWFLPWSIPAGLAMLVLLAMVCLHAAARRFVLCFFLLILGLALSSYLDLKRLLFVTPWLLLAIALACSQVRRVYSIVACVSVSVVFAIGWIGIATQLHPATSNFYEPWKNVADRTAEEAKHGATIVSDSNPYFFYLDYAFGLENTIANGSFLGSDAYSGRGVRVYLNELPQQERLAGKVIAVEGVDTIEPLRMMSATLDRLLHSCRLLASEKSTPDPAIRFKPLLGPAVPMLPYRVVVDHFDCDAAPQ